MWNILQCAESKLTTGVTTLFYPFEARVTYLPASVPVQFYQESEEFLPENMPIDKVIIKI